MSVFETDSVQAEAELLEIKVKAVEKFMKLQQDSKTPQAHINFENPKLEIQNLSQRSEKLFLRSHKMKSLPQSAHCFPEARDLYKRVAGLHTTVMSIKTSSGSEDNTAVLTAQIQELCTETSALKQAVEQKDAKISAIGEEINQLKSSMLTARNEARTNISLVDGKIEAVKLALGQMSRM